MDKQLLWKTVLAELEINLTRGSYKTIFGKSRAILLNDNNLTVGLANGQIKSLVEKKYRENIGDICQRILKKPMGVSFVVDSRPDLLPKDLGPLFEEVVKKNQGPETRAGLNPYFTFANFAVSSSNQLAHAAALAVVKNPGSAYNPLYLWGGVGVGKTHLMQAVGHELFNKIDGFKIVYVTSEQFTNEITMGIRNRNMEKLHAKYRGANCLLIDDIQFIAGKDKTQEEFFHTFNVIREGGGQVILTSDQPPSQIALLEDRIRSRFEQGLVVDIAGPDFELRTAILLIKAKQRGLELPMPVAQFVAEKITESRKLEGILTRLLAESRLKNLGIDINMAGRVIGEPVFAPKKASVKDVFHLIASHYGIKLNDLRGGRRKKEFVWPRQILMWFLHQELGLTLEETGRELGGRDHTTIIYGCDKISQLFKNEERVRTEILGIKQRLVE
ncbi:MAG: chromosomal replication initiator protein DnaA [Patescibacteria group bacterium]|nr:chromosomal replication initiator protein DnaA [Patescibacteria group bacterium]